MSDLRDPVALGAFAHFPDERTADAAPAIGLAYPDRVEEELSAGTGGQRQDVTEDLTDDTAFIGCDPVQQGRIGEIGGSVRSCERSFRLAQALQVEVEGFLGDERETGLVRRSRSGPNTGGMDVSKLEQPVARMLDAYTAAVRAKDVDGLVALYAQDMCVFDMWDRWAYEGVKAWRSMVEDWLGSLGVGRLRGFEAHPPEVTGRGSPPPLRELSDSCERCSPRAAP